MFAGLSLVIFAYLLGSISSGILTCKLLGLKDPRSGGSNSPGATNVLRLGGKKAAVITLIGDVLKGVIPVLIARLLNNNHVFGHHLQFTDLGLATIGFAAFFGHLYPIFFKFKGGKGVATGFGVITALSPALGACVLLTWLIIAFLFRFSSLAALTATVLTPLYSHLLGLEGYVFPLTLIALFVIFRHKANIKRLFRGTEPRIGDKDRD